MNRTPVPLSERTDEREHRRELARILAAVLSGKSNNLIEITLANGATTTTVSSQLIGPDSIIVLVPITANAAALSPWQTWPNAANGQAVIHHANTANNDQNFIGIVVGS